MTTDSKINYDAETNTLDVEKIKNRRKQNFEDVANNMQLDKEDTQRSNIKYSQTSINHHLPTKAGGRSIHSLLFALYNGSGH